MLKPTKPADKPYRPGDGFNAYKKRKKNVTVTPQQRAGAKANATARLGVLGGAKNSNFVPNNGKGIGGMNKAPKPIRKTPRRHKKQSQYEGSALDNKLDRITGFPEGSKKDEAMDKVIAPEVKGKRRSKKMKSRETKKHERGETKAFEAKEKKRTIKKKIVNPQIGKRLENVGANIRKNYIQGQKDWESGKMPYYGSNHLFRGTRTAFMKNPQKRRATKKQ